MFEHITTREFLEIGWFVLSVVGLVFARFFPSLDAEARRWLAKIGGADAVAKLITEAAALCGDTTNSVKRAFVLNELKIIAEKQGLTLSDSMAALLLEWTFNRIKKTLPKCGG